MTKLEQRQACVCPYLAVHVHSYALPPLRQGDRQHEVRDETDEQGDGRKQRIQLLHGRCIVVANTLNASTGQQQQQQRQQRQYKYHENDNGDNSKQSEE
jgi:hypothetical protein